MAKKKPKKKVFKPTMRDAGDALAATGAQFSKPQSG
jgi:hypothetical protein